MRGRRYWRHRMVMVKVFFIQSRGQASTHSEYEVQGSDTASIVWNMRTGEATRKERLQMARLMRTTLVWVSWVGRPEVTWVMDSHRSTAMAVMVAELTRVLVPCSAGTSLHAVSPRYHLPPYRHCISVGGMHSSEVEIPEIPRFRM